MATVIYDTPFYVDENPYKEGYYRVGVGTPVCNQIGYTNGSYNVILARLFGLSYPDFLRFVRKRYNATLYKSSPKMIGVCFKNRADAERLKEELTHRWGRVSKMIGSYN